MCIRDRPSGEVRQILSTCKATIGSVGNSDNGLESSGKAARSRWQGRRPRNRGVVMNPEMCIRDSITGGLPRVTELFEARNPSNPCLLYTSRCV